MLNFSRKCTNWSKLPACDITSRFSSFLFPSIRTFILTYTLTWAKSCQHWLQRYGGCHNESEGGFQSSSCLVHAWNHGQGRRVHYLFCQDGTMEKWGQRAPWWVAIVREGSSLGTYPRCTFFLFLLYIPLFPVGAASYQEVMPHTVWDEKYVIVSSFTHLFAEQTCEFPDHMGYS